MAAAAVVLEFPSGRVRPTVEPEPDEVRFEDWMRGAAAARCSSCKGGGLTITAKVCKCVLRYAFRAVMKKAERTDGLHPQRKGAASWGWPAAEFRCELDLALRRSLTGGQMRVYRAYHVNRADWRLCTRLLGLEKGQFFHEVYRLEERAGREVLLRGLYPPDKYRSWTNEKNSGRGQSHARETSRPAYRIAA